MRHWKNLKINDQHSRRRDSQWLDAEMQSWHREIFGRLSNVTFRTRQQWDIAKLGQTRRGRGLEEKRRVDPVNPSENYNGNFCRPTIQSWEEKTMEEDEHKMVEEDTKREQFKEV